MTSEPLHIGIVQCALGGSREENVDRVLRLVRAAAGLGARLVVTPELLEGPYFCREEKDAFFEWARPVEGNPTLARFQALARELGVVLPFSFFEKAGNAYYNTLAMVDADGALLGTYRKSHIPDGPGYEEKFYFRPGDTGFRVFATKAGKVGGAVCWDQWYPECARALALLGADVLVYPTAIGSEPANPSLDTRDRWRRAMVGHAVSNVIPVAASNRVGEEDGQLFYGSSFVAGTDGSFLAEMGREEEGVRVVTVDLAAVRRERASWGFFRDRRPELYGVLQTADGRG
ncbi:MAG: N-carbamoylputrescine amidase [Thermoanaerobaculia bacterium]